MDGPSSPSSISVQRALQQRLESLARAGVQQLPKWKGSPPPALTTATTAQVPETTARPEAGPQTTAPVPSKPEGPAPSSSDSIAHQPAKPSPASVDPQPQVAPAAPVESVTKTPTIETPMAPVGDRGAALATLQQEVCGCERCPELVGNRTQTVFGVGDANARLCFFGEGPGADEDRQGEPFVGAAGQLLDKIINACTLRREDVYILNTVKCRPPGNRNPTPDEISNCRPFFERQLEIIQPEFICCLGSVAAQALLETQKSVGRLRGTLHSWRFAQVLVTYHPAYLLRNPSAKKMVWQDMKYLMAQMGIDV